MESERIAIITGSAGYVGSAVAKKLAAHGFRIALFYHTSVSAVASLPGSGHAAYQADLTNEEEVRAAVALVERDLGPIDVLVHAAGTGPVRGNLIDASVESLKEEFATNVLGSFVILSEVAKRMKARKRGLIIGITSIAAEHPETGKGLAGYVPAKAALRSLLGLLKAELVSANVRVEEIAPGFMPEGMNANLPQAFKDLGKAQNPAGVPARADDVAEAVFQLCKGVD